MSTRVELPEPMKVWIAQQLPLFDLQTIQFRVCKRLPFLWILPGRNFVGLTLWNRVYLVDGFWNPELIFHELVHVSQYRRNPVLFPLQYLFHHLWYGYERNPAEIEARTIAAQRIQEFTTRLCPTGTLRGENEPGIARITRIKSQNQN